MSYEVYVLRRAQKELAQLPPEAFGRVREMLRALAENPRPSGCLKLTGRDGWRIRVGAYRGVYEVDDREQSVTVLHIGHSKDVYR